MFSISPPVIPLGASLMDKILAYFTTYWWALVLALGAWFMFGKKKFRASSRRRYSRARGRMSAGYSRYKARRQVRRSKRRK